MSARRGAARIRSHVQRRNPPSVDTDAHVGEGVAIEFEPEAGAVRRDHESVVVEPRTLAYAGVESPKGTGSSKKSPLEMDRAT